MARTGSPRSRRRPVTVRPTAPTWPAAPVTRIGPLSTTRRPSYRRTWKLSGRARCRRLWLASADGAPGPLQHVVRAGPGLASQRADRLNFHASDAGGQAGRRRLRLGYDAARRSLGTLRVRPRFPSRHRVIGYVVSATWFPLRRLSSPNWSFTQPALARYGQRRRAIAGRRHDIPAPARYAAPIEAAPAGHVNNGGEKASDQRRRTGL